MTMEVLDLVERVLSRTGKANRMEALVRRYIEMWSVGDAEGIEDVLDPGSSSTSAALPH